MPLTSDLSLDPTPREIKFYFITVMLTVAGFIVREIWVWIKDRNSTAAQDLIQLQKNDMIILNKLDLIVEQLKHKPDRDEMFREIIDHVEKFR